MARPTKYSEDIAKRICDFLRVGNTRKTSAEASGIDYSTLLRWSANNAGFALLLTRAEAEAESLHVRTLAKAAHDGDWRASESWLKRRRRSEWGDSRDITIVKQMTDEELLAAIGSG